MEKDLVSVIFPTMNRKEDLIKCIKSIKEGSHKKVEIVVADNGSVDGSPEAIRKLFPDVVLLASKYNLGSPIAINNCIRKAKGEFIFRLDDDVIVAKDTIERMLKVLKSDKKIGAVGCIFYFTERPTIIRSAGIKIDMFLGRTIVYGREEEDHGQFEGNIQREAVGGGCLLVRKSIYEEIGLFNESYFLCYEDLDWCLKLKKAGYKLIVVGKAKLYHRAGSGLSLKEDPTRLYYMIRGLMMFMRKNGGLYNLVFLPSFFLVRYPYMFFKFMWKKKPEVVKAVTKATFVGMFTRKMIVCTKDGKEIPYVNEFQ